MVGVLLRNWLGACPPTCIYMIYTPCFRRIIIGSFLKPQDTSISLFKKINTSRCTAPPPEAYQGSWNCFMLEVNWLYKVRECTTLDAWNATNVKGIKPLDLFMLEHKNMMADAKLFYQGFFSTFNTAVTILVSLEGAGFAVWFCLHRMFIKGIFLYVLVPWFFRSCIYRIYKQLLGILRQLADLGVLTMRLMYGWLLGVFRPMENPRTIPPAIAKSVVLCGDLHA